jgi:hypothetical protein
VKVLSVDGTAPAEGIRLLLEVERSNLGVGPEVPLNTGLDFSLVDEVKRELSTAGARR